MLTEQEIQEVFAALDAGTASAEQCQKALNLTEQWNAGTLSDDQKAAYRKAASSRVDKSKKDPDPGNDDPDEGDPDDEKLDGEGNDTPPPAKKKTARQGDEGPDVAVRKAAADVVVPAADALETEIAGGADGEVVLDMIEPLQGINKSFAALAESQAALQALLAKSATSAAPTPSADVAALTTLVKSLAEKVDGIAAQVADLSAPPEQRIAKALQTQTAQRLRAMLNVEQRVTDVENVLNRSPYSPHPATRKSVGAGTNGADLSVGQAIEAIQKSVSMKPEQKAYALEQLQYAPQAGVPYAEIVHRHDPKALEGIGG